MDHVAVWAPAIVAVIAVIFNGGQHSSRLGAAEKKIADQDVRIEAHGISIAELKAWRDGYNAGVRRTEKVDG